MRWSILRQTPSGDPFYYAASPGQIADFVVVGNHVREANVTGIDNAYDTPTANPTRTFSNMDSDTPNGPATGDGNSWQADINVLRAQLGGEKLLTFFSFNATGNSANQANVNGPDLLIWARYTLIDLQDSNNNMVFYLQNPGTTEVVPSTFNSATIDNPTTAEYKSWQYGSTVDQPWVYVHGTICMDGTTFKGFPDVNGSCARSEDLRSPRQTPARTMRPLRFCRRLSTLRFGM